MRTAALASCRCCSCQCLCGCLQEKRINMSHCNNRRGWHWSAADGLAQHSLLPTEPPLPSAPPSISQRPPLLPYAGGGAAGAHQARAAAGGSGHRWEWAGVCSVWAAAEHEARAAAGRRLTQVGPGAATRGAELPLEGGRKRTRHLTCVGMAVLPACGHAAETEAAARWHAHPFTCQQPATCCACRHRRHRDCRGARSGKVG